MLPEYGHLALIMALLLSLCLSIIPMAGSYNGKLVWMASARSLSTGMFVFVAISIVLLGVSFYQDDFTVAYVANHSNSLLPVVYKICAVWGGHEGSMLLWVLMLAGWTLAVTIFSRELPLDFQARVLSVLGMVSFGFILFILLTSNPFDRILPLPPMDGADLNPFLQDPGFIFHPPMLYMGYVGFAVIFAFSIAALLSGRLDSAWARWCRPWGNLAWCFLTLGLTLGSWWAYYELGWGGWWFWDPVENAAFMPWLVGTAFIHNLAVSEKRGLFKNWTLFLAIFGFSLSLLGTLLVRSGLLTSVHAFASDPSRGVFIGAFLFIVILASLILFAMRAPLVKSKTGFALLSRDAFLLLNSVVFIVSASIVLLGTLYPVVLLLLGLGAVSVGEPYFNIFFSILMSIAAIATGIGMVLNWKKTEAKRIRDWVKSPALYALWLGTALPGMIADEYSWAAAVSIALGSWVILSCLFDLVRKTRNAASVWIGMGKLTATYYGMIVAHIGFGICLLGVCLDTIYDDQRDLRLELGKPAFAGHLEYELVDVSRVRGPNYNGERAEVIVRKDGETISILHPEKRAYFSGGNIMSEVAIDPGFFYDIYIALGEKLDNTSWSMRIHYKPVVRWIWFGAVFMALGGLIAITDKRYKRKKTVAVKNAVGEGVIDSDADSNTEAKPILATTKQQPE